MRRPEQHLTHTSGNIILKKILYSISYMTLLNVDIDMYIDMEKKRHDCMYLRVLKHQSCQ